ncbi:TULIP family P47-like protein [Mangrovihabitans endophyticus]|nr:TULIP family P47-like protein [Mangrovihabitans endophyticus]
MGWDTVFVCAMDQVNVGLRNNTGDLVTEFVYSDGDVRVEGVFGPWQLVPGGSNKRLRFQTPIVSGKLTLAGRSYDLAGVVPQMELQLAFIDSVSTSTVQDLVFDLQVPGAGPGDATPGAVTTITADATGKVPPGSPAWGVLHDVLPACLIAHREELAYIFASVNLVPPGSASWLAPHAYDYVYVQPAAGDTGYLGVLSVVTPRDTSKLPRAIDTSLLTGEHPLCFMISPDLFLSHVVMPALPSAYGHGAKPGNFVARDGEVHNNGRLSCGTFRRGLIDYHPYLTSLTIRVDGNRVVSAASGRFDITGLRKAYVNFSLGASNICRYDTAKGKISFATDPKPSHHYDIHIPKWEKWIGGIGGPVVLGIVYGVTTGVTTGVANSVSSSLGTDGKLSIAAVAPIAVHWQGLSTFDVQEAGLSNAFYLRGAFAAAD